MGWWGCVVVRVVGRWCLVKLYAVWGDCLFDLYGGEGGGMVDVV